MQLTPEQEAVVDSTHAAIVVSAGAGSGKTEVVAHRVERILQQSPDEEFRVLAVSYTVKAAEELRQRLRSRVGGLRHRVITETVHGFATTVLRRFGTRIGLPPEPELLVQDEDRIVLLQQWVNAEGGGPIDDPAGVLARLDLARARCEDAAYLDAWRAALAQRGALDYPAIVERCTELLDGGWVARNLRRTYRHVIVDEAQNLTSAQYRLLTALIGPPDDHVPSMLVGDERQSIVGFAGADPRWMGRFAEEYSAVRFGLTVNHRSARRIVELTAAVATQLGRKSGAAGRYATEGVIGVQVAPTETAEGEVVAKWVSSLLRDGLPPAEVAPGENGPIPAEEIAVLGRTAASLRQTKIALDRAGIAWAEGSTPDEWVETTTARLVLDLIAFRTAPDHPSCRRRIAVAAGADDDWTDLRSVLRDAPDVAARALLPVVDADNPEALVGGLSGLVVEQDGWQADLAQLVDAWGTFVDDADMSARTFGNFRQHLFRAQRGNPMAAGVRILTVHKAQGREFAAVALVACNDGQFPDFRAKTPAELEAELRTFYVAASRASRALLFTRAASRDTRFGSRSTDPSRFLRFIGTGGRAA